ncbi:MAG: hypothetical protein ACEQSF_00930 [Solirubrobacteraceae bacterium]
MKKLLLAFALPLFLFFSCSQSKNVVAFSSTQLRGSWVLSSIEYSKVGNYKATLFNDSSKDCFVGSQWNLIANNYSGEYILNSGDDCQPGSRKIIWDVVQVDNKNYFQFKKIIQDVKAKNIQSGYRLKIDSLDSNTIIMSQDTFIENSAIQLIYTFVKSK